MKSIYLNFLFLSMLFLGSCSTQQESIPPGVSNFSDHIAVQCKDNYEKGEEATFIVTNKSKKEELFLFHPKEKFIEKRTDEGWKRVNIRYCPCGASCPPPPEWEALNPEATKTIKWDLNEEWCDDTNTERKVPETKEKYAGAGTYRFVLRYSLDKGKEIITDHIKFKLK